MYFYYNRIFFPRDSKDQLKYCKKKKNKRLNKGDIIFGKVTWGYVLIDTSLFMLMAQKSINNANKNNDRVD